MVMDGTREIRIGIDGPRELSMVMDGTKNNQWLWMAQRIINGYGWPKE